MKYPNSFQPLDVHGVTLKNRYIMGSMHTGLEDKNDGYIRLARYFEERAKGGVGLIITGGYSPNLRGRLSPFACQLSNRFQLRKHRRITETVHKYNAKICLQLLHAGRYSYHPFSVAPSKIKSPITPFTPSALSSRGVKGIINDFAKSAKLAMEAGYDGVEIMGSEGYLINQFIVKRTNQRTDKWGGSYENRIRFPLEIIKRVREKTSDKFLIIYRLSMLDLVEHGSSPEEVVHLAKEVEKVGASLINTGIGWHEARVPTIATNVPRAAFSFVTEWVKKEVSIPCIAANRFNNPEDIEQVITEGKADFVSMARPFLADPDFVNKAQKEQAEEINTCIGCNQACLDHIFSSKIASCLVNPKACFEGDYDKKSVKPQKILVIGAGPAGLATALEAKKLGHEVILFDKALEIGGQFNLAKKIPGKEEFYETLRYFNVQLKKYEVDIRLNIEVNLELVKSENPDHVVFCTGVVPRKMNIPGENLPHVISYLDFLKNDKEVGKDIAIVGSGGIGFDVAQYLYEKGKEKPFYDFWGIDTEAQNISGLKKSLSKQSERKVYLLQRSEEKVGSKLGKTTGWVHRLSLKKYGMQTLVGVQYKEIKNEGLVIEHEGEEKTLRVDNILVCAGQVEQTSFYEEAKNFLGEEKVHLIGGARFTPGLDAKRAFKEGIDLIYQI